MNTNQQPTEEAKTIDPLTTDAEMSRIPEVRTLLAKGDIDGLCDLYGSLDESLTGAVTAQAIRIVITEMHAAIKGL